MIKISKSVGFLPIFLSNISMIDFKFIFSPQQLLKELPISILWQWNVQSWKQSISSIIRWKDNRLLVIVWPCSIHDYNAAIEYAEHIQKWRKEFGDTLEIVMRTYFEKPRTTVGWKWLINDPHLNGTYDIEYGIQNARKLLLELTEMGVPVATEFLDPVSHLYLSDIISWWAIGARTTESQIHRELASWLTCPIGFKNSTDGNVKIALDAMLSSCQPHTYLWINTEWQITIVTSTWNPDTHIILRWSNKWINYTEDFVYSASENARKSGMNDRIMIDVSHQNSAKDYKRQIEWIYSITSQLQEKKSPIMWVMIESNIIEGAQSFTPWVDNPCKIEYWKSITDGCVNIADTENMLSLLSEAVQKRVN